MSRVVAVRLALCALLLLAFAQLHGDPGARPAPPAAATELPEDRWAQATLRRMTPEQKIGQMFMVWAKSEFLNVNGPEYQLLRNTVRIYNIGTVGVTVAAEGALLKKSSPYEVAVLTNQLQRDSELPLLFAADFERGLPMRLTAGTVFPHAMAFGAAGNKDFAFLFGRITAAEARAVGIHWNFFPVADVNSNPVNPIINVRSFGEDPAMVSEMVSAYIAGARGMGMLTTAKHFPGHGDGDGDTHVGVTLVKGDRRRLDQVELAPFRAAIAAGVDSVMVAHVAAPSLDPNPRRPASLSPAVIGDLLQREMKFRGLVVTDAMDMGAMTGVFPSLSPAAAAGRTAVEAVKAGEDMLIGPPNLDAAYRALLEAVRNGEISESRIDQSVLKLLRAKAALGLDRSRFVDLNRLAATVSRPESQYIAQQVADSAVTLVRENGLLPLRRTPTPSEHGNGAPAEARPASALAVIFTEDARGESGRMFERWLRARIPAVQVYYVDNNNAAVLTPDVLRAAQNAAVVIAPTYVAPVFGQARGPQGLDVGSQASTLLRALLAKHAAKTVVLAMGSPYLAGIFPQIQNYLCLYSTMTVSEVSAVKALFGEIPIGGRLPVAIPGYASRGTGLDRPVQDAR